MGTVKTKGIGHTFYFQYLFSMIIATKVFNLNFRSQFYGYINSE